MDKTTHMENKPLVNATCKLGNKGCFEDGRCYALVKCENKIHTNADVIRSMTDEELADAIANFHSICELCIYSNNDCHSISDEYCRKGILKWLRLEAERE